MTIRQCNLKGSVFLPESAGSISMNGVEVFNGQFSGELDVFGTIASFSLDVDNALAVNKYVSIPTSITVTSGGIGVGLPDWDYGISANPIYTPEQITLLTAPYTSYVTRLEIYNAVSPTPLSSADQAILLSTKPGDQAARQAILVANNLTAELQNQADFSCSLTDIITRTNVLLDGVEPPNANTTLSVAINEGQVLTYNSLVFISNHWMNT